MKKTELATDPFPIDQPNFQLLSVEEKAKLASVLEYHPLTKNQILIPEGKLVNDVFYIKKGIVRLFLLDEKGNEVNTHIAWDGMFISSLYSLIKQKPSDEAVKTITDCELYRVKYSTLTAMYDAYPKIERLGRLLVEEAFSCMAERGRMLQTMTAKERYVQLMRSIPTEIFRQIPMQEIASFLGIAPGSLSRIRNEFLHIC